VEDEAGVDGWRLWLLMIGMVLLAVLLTLGLLLVAASDPDGIGDCIITVVPVGKVMVPVTMCK
jgi:hypothetical protein